MTTVDVLSWSSIWSYMADLADGTTTLPVVATAVVAALVSLAVLWCSSRTQEKSRRWNVVPGRHWLTGHIAQIRENGCIVDTLETYARDYGGDDGCYEMYIFRTRFVVACNYDRAMEVFRHRPNIVRRTIRIREAANSIGAYGVFSAEGDQWRQEHKLVSAALNRKNVQDYLSVFKLMTDRLVDKWKRQCLNGRGNVSVEDDLGSVAADSIAKAAMDKDFDFLNQPDSLVAQDVKASMNGMIARTRFPFSYWKIPFIGQALDGLGSSIARISKLIQETVIQIEKEDNSQQQVESNRQTFIHKVHQAMKSERSPLPRDRVVGNVVSLFMAGTDTTSKALLSAFYLLGKDTELQSKLRQEADAINVDQANLQGLLESLPRIKSFLHEVHRWYGVPIIGLRTTQEVRFCNTTLPSNTTVMVLSRLVSVTKEPPSDQKDAKFSPTEFCPERWLVKDDQTGRLACPSPSFAGCEFTPFGYGQRSCPGRVYSEALSLCVLASALQTFEWTLADGVPTDARFINDVVMVPQCQVRLTMTLRETVNGS